jgi:hypothetical protein
MLRGQGQLNPKTVLNSMYEATVLNLTDTFARFKYTKQYSKWKKAMEIKDEIKSEAELV